MKVLMVIVAVMVLMACEAVLEPPASPVPREPTPTPRALDVLTVPVIAGCSAAAELQEALPTMSAAEVEQFVPRRIEWMYTTGNDQLTLVMDSVYETMAVIVSEDEQLAEFLSSLDYYVDVCRGFGWSDG